MELFVVLDGTHYPVAVFRNLEAAKAYAVTHPLCYVVRSKLIDA